MSMSRGESSHPSNVHQILSHCPYYKDMEDQTKELLLAALPELTLSVRDSGGRVLSEVYKDVLGIIPGADNHHERHGITLEEMAINRQMATLISDPCFMEQDRFKRECPFSISINKL